MMKRLLAVIVLIGAFVFAAVQPTINIFLTDKELSFFNGKDGIPAYIAVDSVVYDVTGKKGWESGSCEGYSAGQDMSMYMGRLSGGALVLTSSPVVGKLVRAMNAKMVSRSKTQKLEIRDGFVYDVTKSKVNAPIVGKIVN